MTDVAETLLEVEDLRVQFGSVDGPVKAVDGVSYSVERGQALGIVGESGSGKSVLNLTLMGLTRFQGARVSGRARFEGRDLLTASDQELRRELDRIEAGALEPGQEEAVDELRSELGQGRDRAELEMVARETLDQYGTKAVEILRERVEAAEMSGDELAAETWRDIADAAERILRQSGGYRVF